MTQQHLSFPDASFHVSSNLRIQVCSQGPFAFFSLMAADSFPIPHICTPLLPVLLPSFLPFDYFPYPLYTPVTLTYLFQDRKPILTCQNSPWAVCLTIAGLWSTSKHFAPGTLATVQHIAIQARAATERIQGEEIWVICYYIWPAPQNVIPTSRPPVMLSVALPFLLRPGNHKAEKTEQGPVVNSTKGKRLLEIKSLDERPP